MKNRSKISQIKYLIISLSVLIILNLSACAGVDENIYGLFSQESAQAGADLQSAEEATDVDMTLDAANEMDTRQSADGETEEAEDAVEEEPCIDESELVPFDADKAYEYCDRLVSRYISKTDRLLFELNFEDKVPASDDMNLYIFEIATYEDETVLGNLEPVVSMKKNYNATAMIPFETRYLFSRFVPAILYEGKYVPLSIGQYMANPQDLATNQNAYPTIRSKKGLLLDANTIGTEKLSDLNVPRIVYNIPLSFVIGESDNPVFPTIDYDYNGRIYHFDGYKLAGFDALFKTMTDQGYHCTAIILNDWNEEYPQLIHPLSRKKTGSSMYYAFNTQEEEGVRLLEATALFLANRYSGGDYGMVYDWVIANEINQQKIWNYMDTDDLYYYTESFERSFRIFYNAIKSGYSNARVYYSIDHDWNNNSGNNRRFFNGRDIVRTFNTIATERGNYDWNISIHPYPQPLSRTKFWIGSFNKTEDARIITPMNLSALTSFLNREELLNTSGDVRDVAVTELGFCSKAGEKIQAAAFAYCYYIIEDNEYVSTFLLNRQTDDLEALRSGLALGIYNNDYSSKRIVDVFTKIDSKEAEGYIPELLKILGADSLEEALFWAR